MTQQSISQFCWNELATTNVRQSKEFYSKVFGWQFTDIQSDVMTYTLIKVNDKDIGGMWQIPTDQQEHIPPHWMAYILVENVADSLKAAKQHGATEVKGVTQAGDMGQFAIIVDPNGAHIALWEPNN